jgi:hypothetical protein
MLQQILFYRELGFDGLSKASGFRDFTDVKKVYVLRGDKRIPLTTKKSFMVRI